MQWREKVLARVARLHLNQPCRSQSRREESRAMPCFAESLPELKYFLGCKSFSLIQCLIKPVQDMQSIRKTTQFLCEVIPLQHK